MGLPVVALIGDTFLSRASFSVLGAAGVDQFATATAADYIKKCVELSDDTQSLAALRASLRSRLNQSPLLNAPLLARNLETALREMWRAWCARGAA